MVKLFKLTRNLSCFMERCFFRSDLTRYSSSEHTMKWNPTSAAGRWENMAKFFETTELCRKGRHFSLAYFFFPWTCCLLAQLPGTEAAGVTTYLANFVLPLRCWELGNSEMVIMEHQVRLFSLILLDTQRGITFTGIQLCMFSGDSGCICFANIYR